MVVEKACGGGRGRGDSGDKGRLKGAQGEREKNANGLWGVHRTPDLLLIPLWKANGRIRQKR
jgi:hypothetical protein